MRSPLPSCRTVAFCLSLLVLIAAAFTAPTPPAQAAPSLHGETSKPKMNVFVLGEPVELRFTIEGLAPNQAGITLKVDVTDVDHNIRAHADMAVKADATGKWSGTTAAPSDALGYYEVAAKTDTGLDLPAVESRPAGYMTYMVVVDPSKRVQPGEDAFFGMQGGFTTAFDARPYMGIHWVLGGYTWREYEPDHAGQWAEKRQKDLQDPKFAQNIADNRKLGILPLPCLYFAPKWAVDPATLQYCTGTLTNPDAWANYCREVGKAFPQDYPWLRKHVYQITWEPVYPWGYKGTDEDLVRIYEIAHRALHEVDPKAVVVGPTGAGISADQLAWNERLFKKGLGRYIDALSIHPYIGQPPEKYSLIEDCRTLKEMVRTYVGRDLDLYGTEQGWATGQDKAKERPQAEWITRSNLIMLGEGFKANMAFYFTDYPGEPGYGMFHNLNMTKIPWGTDAVSPKPLAAAYSAMTMVLEGYRSAGPIEWLGQTVMGYAYEQIAPAADGTHPVTLALWDFGAAPHAVTVPAGEDQVEVIDWMGNGHKVATTRGSVQLTLSGAPTYVRGVSPALWGTGAKRPLALSPATLTAYPGDRVQFQVKAAGVADRKLEGLLKIEVPDQLEADMPTESVSVRPDAEKTVPAGFVVPVDAAPGTYSVKASVEAAGDLVGFATAVLRVKEPFAVESVLPTRSATGSPGVAVSIRNMRAAAVTGKVRVRVKGVPGTLTEAPLNLSPSGTAKVNLPCGEASAVFPDPARVYQAVVTISDSLGASVSTTQRVTFPFASRAATPPKFGLDPDAWRFTQPIVLQGREWIQRQPQQYHGVKDLSATLWYAWDDRALYFRADVTDDVFVQEHTGFDTWNGDCVQLAFDPDPGRALVSTGNLLADAGNRKRNTEIDLALTKNGPEAYRTMTFDQAKLPVAAIPPERLQLTIRKLPGKVIYEAAIPWAEIAVARPNAGDVIGVAAAVNDIDDPQTEHDPKALCLFGGIAGTKDPSQFGTLLLVRQR